MPGQPAHPADKTKLPTCMIASPPPRLWVIDTTLVRASVPVTSSLPECSLPLTLLRHPLAGLPAHGATLPVPPRPGRRRHRHPLQHQQRTVLGPLPCPPPAHPRYVRPLRAPLPPRRRHRLHRRQVRRRCNGVDTEDPQEVTRIAPLVPVLPVMAPAPCTSCTNGRRPHARASTRRHPRRASSPMPSSRPRRRPVARGRRDARRPAPPHLHSVHG